MFGLNRKTRSKNNFRFFLFEIKKFRDLYYQTVIYKIKTKICKTNFITNEKAKQFKKESC